MSGAWWLTTWDALKIYKPISWQNFKSTLVKNKNKSKSQLTFSVSTHVPYSNIYLPCVISFHWATRESKRCLKAHILPLSDQISPILTFLLISLHTVWLGADVEGLVYVQLNTQTVTVPICSQLTELTFFIHVWSCHSSAWAHDACKSQVWSR